MQRKHFGAAKATRLRTKRSSVRSRDAVDLEAWRWRGVPGVEAERVDPGLRIPDGEDAVRRSDDVHHDRVIGKRRVGDHVEERGAGKRARRGPEGLGGL